MSRHKAEASAAGTAVGDSLTWLGGGYASDAAESQERSAYQVTGLIVLLTGVLAWLVAAVAIAGSTTASVWLVIPFTLVVGLLVGAIARTLAGGRPTRWYGFLGRGLVALFIGVVLGELAAIGIFSGSVDQKIEQQAVERTASAPAVVNATRALTDLRADRAGLDTAVDEARSHMNDAFIRANCEFNPQPSCPAGITGVPGAGPETRSANEIYLDAKGALALAESNREQQAPSLDAEIAQANNALAAAKAAAPSDVDRGLSGRWTAMHDYTAGNVGALLLRILTIALFSVLMLLPLLLKLWRGETILDRSSAAESVRRQAEIDAETRIAVERAAARVEAEKLWTEQKLTSARFAAEAETAIEREHHRRRVVAAFDDAPTAQIPATLDFAPAAALTAGRHQRPESTPIADEVEAEIAEAEFADAPLDYAPGRELAVQESAVAPRTAKNLPAAVAPGRVEPKKEAPAKPPSVGLPRLNPLPDLTRAVTGIVRPFVPDVVTKITAANPVRTARKKFEEFEEINFSFSRKRTVTVDEEVPEETAVYRQAQTHQQISGPAATATALPRVHSTRVVESPYREEPQGLDYRPWNADALGAGDPEDWSRSLSEREGHRELVEREGPAALDERRGPRELPPGS